MLPLHKSLEITYSYIAASDQSSMKRKLHLVVFALLEATLYYIIHESSAHFIHSKPSPKLPHLVVKATTSWLKLYAATTSHGRSLVAKWNETVRRFLHTLHSISIISSWRSADGRL